MPYTISVVLLIMMNYAIKFYEISVFPIIQINFQILFHFTYSIHTWCTLLLFLHLTHNKLYTYVLCIQFISSYNFPNQHHILFGYTIDRVRSNLFVSQSVKLKTCITSEFISLINMLNHPRNFNQKERRKNLWKDMGMKIMKNIGRKYK